MRCPKSSKSRSRRGQQLYRQEFSRGLPLGKLKTLGRVNNRRGTKMRFKPDAQIFGASAHWKPARLFRMSRSKAYLFGGVEIRWRCAPALIEPGVERPGRGGVALSRRPEGLSRSARSRARSASPTSPSPARSRAKAAMARSNGRSPGSPTTTASSTPIATPSRRPTAARMRPGFRARAAARAQGSRRTRRPGQARRPSRPATISWASRRR